jgi:hypothetical protein
MSKTRDSLLSCMKALVVVTPLFLLGACSSAPMKGYTGPERPANETALIRSADIGISIESCDNIKATSNTIIILPGEHIVGMSFKDPDPEGYYSIGTAFARFTSEAGHTYLVDKKLHSAPGMFSPLIIDQATGKQVSVPIFEPGTEEQKLALIDKSIKEHPQQAEFWVTKGYLLANLRRYGEALPILERATTLKPYLAEAWAMKSGVLCELKRYDEALTAIDKAIQLRPNEQVLRKIKQDITKRINSGT